MKPNRFRFHAPSPFSTPLRYGVPVFAGLFITFTGLHANAGDILRGGAGANTNPTTDGAATPGGAATPAATNAARSNARDMLARTTQTLDAMKAVQTAARAAAAAGPNQLGTPAVPLPIVPNGLGVGGLHATGGNTAPSQWVGANAPTQEIVSGKTTVTIKQTTQQALLHWNTFNVGKETTLTFDQKAGGQNVGQWIAFNKVNDVSANPTQILGNIKADGQIYIINRNGIIFGGSSQVNARGLTVSSLPINDNLINRGLLNNPDAQFLFSGLSIPAGLNGTPSFTPEGPPASTGKYGDVVVQSGAILNSPTNAAKVGGRITLVGPNVVNNGTILTPDGQAILAAGLQVGFEGHASSDPSLRGLDVIVGAVADPTAGLYTGTVNQNGLIETPRGSITLAGRQINQNGGLVSTTSVSLNGRIDIQAQYNAVSNRATTSSVGALFLFKDTGAVNVGANSVTQILPEYDSKETTIGTELALRSQINVVGKTIRLGLDSIFIAPNAIVNLSAGNWLFENNSPPLSTFVQSGGQVYFEQGAAIDVAGSLGVSASVSQNIISVDLRSAELADSPLQRIGLLRNAKVEVDIRKSGDGWIGTPLADVSGFANLIQRSVSQLTVTGGSVTIKSGGSVVMQEGSQIAVSGGSTQFEGAMIRTTQLISGSRLVDIGSASPNVVYDGIYDGSFTEKSATKFGPPKTYNGVLTPGGYRYEAGYTEGATGGKLSIIAPSMALDGQFSGTTVIGENQRLTPPAKSSLSLAFLAQDLSYSSIPLHAPTPPSVTFRHNINQIAAEPFALDTDGNPLELRADRKNLVELSPNLLDGNGFGSLTIDNHDGDIIVPENVNLVAPTGGAITFKASNINIESSVTARAGSLSFYTYGLTLDEINLIQNSAPSATPPSVQTGRGIFTLRDGGHLNASGLIVDDRLNSGIPSTNPALLNAGKIHIEGYSANLAAGGLIDVSGGASISPRGDVSYGNGGSLSILTGREIGFNSALGGQLTLGSELLGLSGPQKTQGVSFPKAKVASLSITGPAFKIGGNDTNSSITHIQPDFFSLGGFGTINLTGIGLGTPEPGVFIPAIVIEDNTHIQPIVKGWLASVKADNTFALGKIIRDEGERHAINLSFAGIGASFDGSRLAQGDVIMGENSRILTDGKGTVSFKGQTVTLRGEVVAPGGEIIVSGSAQYPSDGGTPPNALPTVHLANSAILNTAGKTILESNSLGLRRGEVLQGGKIAITGNIVAESGALMDVSGTTGTLDLRPHLSSLDSSVVESLAGANYVPVSIDSNAGTINLKGNQMLFSDATLLGNAGGTSANGGTLNISSGRFLPENTAYTSADANLVVKQGGKLLSSTNTSIGTGIAVLDSEGNIAPQIGNFSMDEFANGGFDSLSLGGNVRFEGSTSIQVVGSLKVADGGVIYANKDITLTAAHVALGQTFRTPTQQTTLQLFTKGVTGISEVSTYNFGPAYGLGSLTVNAKLIDIGDLSLQGIGRATFRGPNGDIRGNGTLQIAGDLTFESGQIYPTTQRRFNVFAYDYESEGTLRKGTVTALGGITRALPLSAGGTLSIYASQITQAGVLRAPVGKINLGWDGTGAAPINPIAGSVLTSPVTSTLTLAADSVTSVSTINPLTGKPTVIPYGISQDGKSWIDPAGNDITVNGVPGKSVNLAAVDLVTEQGSVVDISGGGDLYAYRWISGNGGTQDILASSTSFAVIPSYGFDYSPYAPFNNDSSATNLDGATGYVNSSLKAGDQITLSASKNLAAGTYTLLPARYALLPGAVLITPKSSVPAGTVNSPDGATIVSGYRSNNLDPSRTGPTLIGGFEIATSKVFRARAEYQDLLANSVLREAAVSREFTVPRLPVDAGYLAFSSTSNMALRGRVSSFVPISGRGSLIDINSSSDIVINQTGAPVTGAGLVLSAGTLNSFGAESLLIGGLRNFTAGGVSVTANSKNVTLDNAGSALIGDDIILVSREQLTLGENSEIVSTEDDDISLDTLLLGSTTTAGSGNGTLVRVSANASGGITRVSTNSSNLPVLTVSAGATLTGGNIVLDSSSATNLSESARLIAKGVSLNSGQISISLNDPGILNPTTGLVLAGDAFTSLQSSAKRLSLVSYSTIDVYGTGTVGSRNFQSLSLQAASIRGLNTNGGTVTFSATSLILGNSAGNAAPTVLPAPLSGSVILDADQITLGANAVRLDGYADATLTATGSILTEKQGSLDVSGNLDLITPLLTGAAASKYQIRSDGALELSQPAVSRPSPFNGGFGADLTLQADSVKINSDITLPSGKLTLRATTGDLTVGDVTTTTLNLAGTSTTFIDTIRYTSGGTVNLISDSGSVSVQAAATINVSAKEGGGNAGTIQAKAPSGTLDLTGAIIGTSGDRGEKGNFSLDMGSITGGSLAALDAILNAGSFTQSRDYRIRTGNVNIDGPATSHIYRVSADAGNITVSDIIDASGVTGGIIDLKANGNLSLTSSSLLDASATRFDSAGKGGSITLEAGNQRNGLVQTTATLDLQTGSSINLSVAEANSGSAALGKFTGTLHLRAPRNTANTELQINAIGSSITGASSILVEGVKLYSLTGTSTITSTLQSTIHTDATAFLGAAGTTAAGYSAMLGRLTSLQPSLDLILAPGAEIYNLSGDLTLGTTTSTATSDWNLETFRYGPKSAPGVLTLRAKGDLVFYNALSDGFAGVTPNATNGQSSLWLAPLMERNNLLPANTQSWSYRFTSGADHQAADFKAVLPESDLALTKGSLLLGKNYGNAANFGSGPDLQTSLAIRNRYQTIRTGTGNISISSGRDVFILNQFASIYTAGTLVPEPTRILANGDFVLPQLINEIGLHPDQGETLGVPQQLYPVQYSMSGGNIEITAVNDISRKTRNSNSATGGILIDDSSRQLPNNWLYRRGYVDKIAGIFGVAGTEDGSASINDPAASTTWWIDFSNFFEGVGTLGGGNIEIHAGNDVKNIDAVAPTNARIARGIPDASKMVELGGGDITLHAGRNIDGGVYYLERGNGVLAAGNEITTNSTRSPSRGINASLTNPVIFDQKTWLPTTLFLGKGSFDLKSSNNLLLGPIENPFLLPQGIGNKFWYKTYFSTYSEESSVSALSLGGTINFRTRVSLPNEISSRPSIEAWLTSQQSQSTSLGAARFQPWLRLTETTARPFTTLIGVASPSLKLTSISGDLSLTGSFTLFPSRKGQLELLAKGQISGLQASGISTSLGVQRWIYSTINVSDSNPLTVPSPVNPYAYQEVVGMVRSEQIETGSGAGTGFLNTFNIRFNESGGLDGSLEDEQARHTSAGLHTDDPDPVRVYALQGNIEGINLFTPKATRIIAGLDIGDVGFFLQNLTASDLSMVSAGRDLTLFNASTNSRAEALASISSNPSVSIQPLVGDIQISGPGNLLVLAGQNLDLGLGSGNADGTGTGITSIGNARNPYLGFEGANMTLGAGIGPANSLSNSLIAFDQFIAKFASSPDGNRYLAEAMGILGVMTDYEGTKTLEKGIKILSVKAGGAADLAGLKIGDVILKVGDKEIPANYDDSYLLSGIQIGVATKVQVLRDGVVMELDITPGNDLLNLADPLLTQEQQKQLAMSIFYLALRDTGRDFNDPNSPNYRKYDTGFAAIKTLFPESTSWKGEIFTQSRDIRTRSVGNISIFAPGGGLTMANTTIGNPLTPPGIVTESGGNISIFTDQSVNIGIGRIFTLKGGNVSIWSSKGDIAAGSSSRTVSAAPPTRVIIDPQSASVETDLAGLATGGGIGVLATVEGVAPGNVDLIAPTGIIDAGDAGIRVSGNINLAAVTVVNAGNISAGGSSAGAPVAASAPSVSTVTSASNSSAAAGSTVEKPGEEQKTAENEVANNETPSLYTVEVIGYGGGSAEEEEDEKNKKKEGEEEEQPEKPTEGAEVL